MNLAADCFIVLFASVCELSEYHCNNLDRFGLTTLTKSFLKLEMGINFLNTFIKGAFVCALQILKHEIIIWV